MGNCPSCNSVLLPDGACSNCGKTCCTVAESMGLNVGDLKTFKFDPLVLLNKDTNVAFPADLILTPNSGITVMQSNGYTFVIGVDANYINGLITSKILVESGNDVNDGGNPQSIVVTQSPAGTFTVQFNTHNVLSAVATLIAAAQAAKRFSQTLSGTGAPVTYVVNHGLGTQDLVFELLDLNGVAPFTFKDYGAFYTVQVVDANNVNVIFTGAPGANNYKIILKA